MRLGLLAWAGCGPSVPENRLLALLSPWQVWFPLGEKEDKPEAHGSSQPSILFPTVVSQHLVPGTPTCLGPPSGIPTPTRRTLDLQCHGWQPHCGLIGRSSPAKTEAAQRPGVFEAHGLSPMAPRKPQASMFLPFQAQMKGQRLPQAQLLSAAHPYFIPAQISADWGGHTSTPTDQQPRPAHLSNAPPQALSVAPWCSSG